MTSSSAIYQIRNLITNKFYIGSAINPNRRWSQHKHDLNRNAHKCRHLQFSWNKHGEAAFEFRIVEVVEDKSKLLEREQFWLDWMKPEYNIYKIAGSPLGIKHTEIARANMSKAHIGYKHTEEQKRKISIANKGRKRSEQTRLNISIAQKKIESKRKVDKWPCAEGIKCKCEGCIKKRSDYSLIWYHANANRKAVDKLKTALNDDITEIEMFHENMVVIKMPTEQFEIIRKVLGL